MPWNIIVKEITTDANDKCTIAFPLAIAYIYSKVPVQGRKVSSF